MDYQPVCFASFNNHRNGNICQQYKRSDFFGYRAGGRNIFAAAGNHIPPGKPGPTKIFDNEEELFVCMYSIYATGCVLLCSSVGYFSPGAKVSLLPRAFTRDLTPYALDLTPIFTTDPLR